MLINIWNYGGGFAVYIGICWFLTGNKFPALLRKVINGQTDR